ncbi:unnamed protein product [marine sediment metagenome]|uniref:Uncharacterized protein n=1 Tax=marine sediment metagenome TaxID=412755 RepID=X1Q3E5_9ZZZZ
MDGAWFIWFDGHDCWYLSTVLGVRGESYWDHFGLDPTGDYYEAGGAEGECWVNWGEH